MLFINPPISRDIIFSQRFDDKLVKFWLDFSGPKATIRVITLKMPHRSNLL